MAKILDDTTFDELTKRTGGPGRPKLYDFAAWFTGDAFMLEPGTDFHAKPKSFVTTLYTEARKAGVNIKVKPMADGTILVKKVGVAEAETTEVAE